MNSSKIKNKASFKKALITGFKSAWENLGVVMLATTTTVLFSSLTMFITATIFKQMHVNDKIVLIVTPIPMSLVFWILSTGIYYYSNKQIFGEFPEYSDLIYGIRVLFKPALILYMANLLISAILAADIVFVISLANAGNHFVVIFAVLLAYITLFWLMMCLYQMPLLITQLKVESGTGVLVIWKKSALISLDNMGFTLGLLFVIIAFAVICIAPFGFGLVTVFFGSAAYIQNNALKQVFIKYEMAEAESDEIEDKPWKVSPKRD